MLQISWYFTCKYLSSMYFLSIGTFSSIIMYHYCNWEINSNSVLLSTVEKSTVTQYYPIFEIGMKFHFILLEWKISVFIPIPKKGNAKECSNYCTIALISHASKVMLKILQAKLQQYMNQELPYVQPGFRKGKKKPEIKLPTTVG